MIYFNDFEMVLIHIYANITCALAPPNSPPPPPPPSPIPTLYFAHVPLFGLVQKSFRLFFFNYNFTTLPLFNYLTETVPLQAWFTILSFSLTNIAYVQLAVHDIFSLLNKKYVINKKVLYKTFLHFSIRRGVFLCVYLYCIKQTNCKCIYYYC